MKKLIDWIPLDARWEQHLHKYFECEVVKEYKQGFRGWLRWPGKHKNVMNWCVLSNGKAVGFNENPAVGWSFPVITYKK